MLCRYRLWLKQGLGVLLLVGIHGALNSVMAACSSIAGNGDMAMNLPLPSQITVPANTPDYTVLAQASAIPRFTCKEVPGENNGIAETLTLSTYNITSRPLGNNLYSTNVPGVAARLSFSDAVLNGQMIGAIDPNSTYYNVRALYFSVMVELIKIGNIADKSVLSSIGSTSPGWSVTGYAPFTITYPASSPIWGTRSQINTFGTGFPITFNVEQPRASCHLTTPSLTIPLQAVSINTLNQTPAYQAVNAGSFNIGVACTANARVALAFTDAYNLNNDFLQLNSTTNNQAINGVGLSIIPIGSQYKASNIIRDSLPVDFIGNLNQNIPFAVYYQRHPNMGPVMVPGEFRSVANFTLTYQ